MFVFDIDCPNEGLGAVMQALKKYGIESSSRNGPVIRFPEPVCLQYQNPRRRLLDHPVRDANHFFHMFETMWMLAGLNTVKPLDLYNSGMKQYSDDGVTFAAPYGHRWRSHFGFDQLKTAVEKLRKDPTDRRIVVQMWDPEELSKTSGKDFACNQQMMFDTRPHSAVNGGYLLDMTVTNRSNDLIYGAMGSNLYHFSLVHEFVARHAGLGLGTYYQISKNMHLYLENETSQRCWKNMDKFKDHPSPGTDGSITDYGIPFLSEDFRKWVEQELTLIGDAPGSWLDVVATPVAEAYRVYKTKYRVGIDTPLEARLELALEILGSCKSLPLRKACADWFQRRRKYVSLGN